jgi:RHH-type rel operon transcriptional repressor/antitoxin RelB
MYSEESTMNTIAEPSVQINVRMPKNISDRLDALAANSGRSKAYYVRQAVTRHIQEMEAVQIAEQSYRDMLAGKVKYTPLEEVIAHYVELHPDAKDMLAYIPKSDAAKA